MNLDIRRVSKVKYKAKKEFSIVIISAAIKITLNPYFVKESICNWMKWYVLLAVSPPKAAPKGNSALIKP